MAQDEVKLLRAIVRLLGRDMDIRDVPGFELQTPIRWGNSAPGKAEHDTGERAPRKSHARRPHGDAPRHAHAGRRRPAVAVARAVATASSARVQAPVRPASWRWR